MRRFPPTFTLHYNRARHADEISPSEAYKLLALGNVCNVKSKTPQISQMGVEIWNFWRERNRRITPDLRKAKLARRQLQGANLSDTDLSGADLRGADLTKATLIDVILTATNLREATLTSADLSGADLAEADFNAADLSGAQVKGAILYGTNLNSALLSDADLSECRMGWTSLGDIDLSHTKGMNTIYHDGPSTIGLDTIYRSGAKISISFLRGTGIADNFIADMKTLASIGFHSCFISYSSQDQKFAEHLHNSLRSKGIRCWFAPRRLLISRYHETCEYYPRH